MAVLLGAEPEYCSAVAREAKEAKARKDKRRAYTVAVLRTEAAMKAIEAGDGRCSRIRCMAGVALCDQRMYARTG